MRVKYTNEMGKKFDNVRKGEVFEFRGIMYMKLEEGISEINTLKKAFNCVDLMTGELSLLKRDDSVQIREVTLVVQ